MYSTHHGLVVSRPCLFVAPLSSNKPVYIFKHSIVRIRYMLQNAWLNIMM